MIAGIILAAGESRRMRESGGVDMPKQLLPWGNTIMLQQVINNATSSKLDTILVVLGYGVDKIVGRLVPSSAVRVLFNPDFKTGMSSSLKYGIRNMPFDTRAFIILLGDQPLIGSEIIDRLIEVYRLGQHGIVIPVHSGHRGHPVLFDCRYRSELLSIGDQIAKEVIMRHAEDVFEVEVDTANVLLDVDTVKEYQDAIALRASVSGSMQLYGDS